MQDLRRHCSRSPLLDPGKGHQPRIHRGRDRLRINFAETANRYSDGSSEELLGRVSEDFTVRLKVDADRAVVERAAEFLKDRDVSRSQIAPALVANRPRITGPLAGATNRIT